MADTHPSVITGAHTHPSTAFIFTYGCLILYTNWMASSPLSFTPSQKKDNILRFYGGICHQLNIFQDYKIKSTCLVQEKKNHKSSASFWKHLLILKIVPKSVSSLSSVDSWLAFLPIVRTTDGFPNNFRVTGGYRKARQVPWELLQGCSQLVSDFT